MARVFARLGKKQAYKWEPVSESSHGNLIGVPNATAYFVRFRNKDGQRKVSKSVETLADAKLLLAQCKVEEAGGEPPVPVSKPAQPVEGRVRIADAANQYKHDIQIVDKAKATVKVYSNAINGFVLSCKKTFIDEIERRDVLDYIEWMRAKLQVRVKGRQNLTIRNRLVYLGTFLAKYGVQLKKSKASAGLISSDDLPRVVKQKPKKYDQDTINLLLKHADVDQKDYLDLLLWSGLRDEEVQYLQYADFDWKKYAVKVQAKPQFGWRPKDCEERVVDVLPKGVCAQLRERMNRPQQYPNGYRKPTLTDLVFPNGDGRPDSHLIYRLHAVAGKAGLNLKGKRAGHLFRKTFGSRIAKKLGLPEAMRLLGHADVQTTALYLAADTEISTQARNVIEDLYAHGD